MNWDVLEEDPVVEVTVEAVDGILKVPSLVSEAMSGELCIMPNVREALSIIKRSRLTRIGA